MTLFLLLATIVYCVHTAAVHCCGFLGVVVTFNHGREVGGLQFISAKIMCYLTSSSLDWKGESDTDITVGDVDGYGLVMMLE